MINVNKSECKQCYACIAQCPYNFIIEKDEHGFPKSRRDFDEHCIDCFHCVSICRNTALSHSKLSPENCFSIQKALSINPEQATQYLQTRRSLRSFKKKTVSREILNNLMNITRWAPTASNSQSLQWLVLESPAKVQEMAEHVINWLKEENTEHDLTSAWDNGIDLVLRGAPHLVIAHLDADRFWGFSESAIALTYLELAANANNIGSCWAGYFTKAANVYPPLREALDIPDSNKVFGALMIGYTKYRLPRIPNRKELHIKWS